MGYGYKTRIAVLYDRLVLLFRRKHTAQYLLFTENLCLAAGKLRMLRRMHIRLHFYRFISWRQCPDTHHGLSRLVR